MSHDLEPLAKDIQVVRTENFAYVDKLARSMTLLYAKDFYPYQASVITLEAVDISTTRPCALYVLEQGLEMASDLRDALLTQGIDTLALTEVQAQIVYNWKGQTNCIISPPVVEISEDDGNMPVITDGLHRVMLAKQEGITQINSIVIRNTAYPLPALPVEWEEVKVCQLVPPSDEKRRYRFKSPEELESWPRLSQRNQERFLQGLENGNDAIKNLSTRLTELHSSRRR